MENEMLNPEAEELAEGVTSEEETEPEIQNITVTDTLVGNLSANGDAEIKDSLAGVVAAGRDMKLSDGAGIIVAVGANLEMEDAGAVQMNVGGNVKLKASTVGLMMAGGNVELEEGSKIVMTSQQAAIFGAVAGSVILVGGLLSRLFRRK